MNEKFVALAMILIGVFFLFFGIKFQDKGAAGYITKIRMIGAAILLFVSALALLIRS